MDSLIHCSTVVAVAVGTAAETAAAVVVVGTAAAVVVGTAAAVDLPGNKPHLPVLALLVEVVCCSFSVSSLNKLLILR